MCDGGEFELGADFPPVTSSHPLTYDRVSWLIPFSLPGEPAESPSHSEASGKDPGLEEQEVYDEACLCCVTLETSQCFSGLLPRRPKWEESPLESVGLYIHMRSCSHQPLCFYSGRLPGFPGSLCPGWLSPLQGPFFANGLAMAGSSGPLPGFSTSEFLPQGITLTSQEDLGMGIMPSVVWWLFHPPSGSRGPLPWLWLLTVEERTLGTG